MAGELYLPPKVEISQGDIYLDAPSVSVRARPLQVARHFQKKGGRDIPVIHTEGESPPRTGFRFALDEGGEAETLVHGFLGMAIVLSHDCEIENDPNVRTIAMIRPVAHLEAEAQEALFSGDPGRVQYAYFPLEAQEEPPTVERCFVDFRRLTTVRPEVLEQTERVASLSDELRHAVARAFYLYLFRRVTEAPN